MIYSGIPKKWCMWGGAGMLMLAAAVVGCSAVKNLGDSMGGPVGGMISGAATVGQAQMMNEKDAEPYGRSLAIAATNTYPPTTDMVTLTYVNNIGQTLVCVSAKPDRHYIFGVLESPKVGAFSGPNGYVFITRGAVNFAQDESEIAGILAHELTHVMDEDGLNAVKSELTTSGVFKIGAAALRIDDALPAIDKMNSEILQKGYDKKQEFNADKGAVKLMIAAGYDPNGLLNFLKRMDAANGAADNGGGLMSTHPGTHERIGKVAAQIASSGYKGGATLKDRFTTTVHPQVTMVMPGGDI